MELGFIQNRGRIIIPLEAKEVTKRQSPERKMEREVARIEPWREGERYQ